MGRKPSPTPTYRRHSARNLAFVEIRGKRTYLGPYGSPESKAAYANIILELSAGDKTAQAPGAVAEVVREARNVLRDVSINELILRFVREFLKPNYTNRDGKEASEVENFRQALRP